MIKAIKIIMNVDNKAMLTMNTDKKMELIDLHLHAGWTDFDHADQEKRSKDEISALINGFLIRYKAEGIITARDAGGFDGSDSALNMTIPGVTASDYTNVIPSCEMLDGDILENAYDHNYVINHNSAGKKQPHSLEAQSILNKIRHSTNKWTKIFITGGVGVSPQDVVIPKANEKQFKAMVKWLHDCGKKVMVHCYGGDSLDWCIESEVDTVEHAVYMTKEQAGLMAEKGIAVVPTTSIYRLLSEKPELFGIPQFIQENAKYACEAQLKSVKYALDAGVLIGYGTDLYADMKLAEYARYELVTLRDCGLNTKEALATGTANAKRILEI